MINKLIPWGLRWPACCL